MSDADITMTAPQGCPQCGYSVDAISPIGHEAAKPGEGDWLICLACAGVNRCTADLRLVPSSLDDPDADPETRADLLRAIDVIEFLRRRNPEWPAKFRRRGRHKA